MGIFKFLEELLHPTIAAKRAYEEYDRVSKLPRPIDPMFKARWGHGTWVKPEDMHPQTNVYGRVYSTKEGRLRRFYPGNPSAYGDVHEWFFPEERDDTCLGGSE